jgi:hypothetical protein
MNLLGISGSRAVDTGVMHAFKHEHLVIGFGAQVAYFADVHL